MHHFWIRVVWLLPSTNELSVHFTPQGHSDETKKFWQSNFRYKLAWTMKQHDVSPARVINADETCVWLLPANSYGWSQVGGKARQLCSSKAAVTGTLAVPTDATTPLYLQLIFEGKTDARLPNRDDIPDQVSGDPFCASSKHTVKTPEKFAKPPCSQVFISRKENHWQTVSSLEDFMVFLDLNLGEARKDWIFVLDLASIHRVLPALRRGHVQDVEICADSCCQRELRQERRGWPEHQDHIGLLKRRSVVWAEKATLHIQNRIELRKSAWKPVSWESGVDFARL